MQNLERDWGGSMEQIKMQGYKFIKKGTDEVCVDLQRFYDELVDSGTDVKVRMATRYRWYMLTIPVGDEDGFVLHVHDKLSYA